MIVMYGTSWCGGCARSKAFLKDKGVDFKFVNIENDDKALEKVEKLNKGMKSVPTIVFDDGSVLVEPSNEELNKKLKL